MKVNMNQVKSQTVLVDNVGPNLLKQSLENDKGLVDILNAQIVHNVYNYYYEYI